MTKQSITRNLQKKLISELRSQDKDNKQKAIVYFICQATNNWKIVIFYSSQDTIKKMKTQATEQEKIVVNPSLIEDLYLKYKKFSRLNKKEIFQ